MAKISIDIDELKKQRDKLQKEIAHIDWLLENYGPKHSGEQLPLLSDEEYILHRPVSKMRQALKICKKYLKDGHIVYTMTEFLALLKTKGIMLTRGGLILAFRLKDDDGEKIVYDSDIKQWVIKKDN